MTVENWPGRGYYRGNKQAMLNDAAKLFGGTMIATPALEPAPAPVVTPLASLDPPSIGATDPALDPKARGYTGNECQNPDCRSLRMVVSGHCEVCLDCGSSSGCS